MRNEGDGRPLHFAAKNGHLAVAEELAAWEAEASAADTSSWRPLHLSAVEGHLAVAEHLAARGAEASAAEKDGWRPFHFAAFEGHLAVAEHLTARGAKASAVEKDGMWPLHLAVKKGHLNVMRHLLNLIPDEVVGRDDTTTELFGGSAARTFVDASRRRNLCCAEALSSHLRTLATVAGHVAVPRYLLGDAW